MEIPLETGLVAQIGTIEPYLVLTTVVYVIVRVFGSKEQ